MGIFPAGLPPSNPTMNIDTDGSFPINDDSVVPTEKAIKTYVDARQRKIWVNGVERLGAFIYSTKAVSSSGSATFWLTSDGASTGTAIFSNIYSDTISVNAYGANGNYQCHTFSVAGDRKSITVGISQITTVLGLLTFNSTAGSGLDCRIYVVGD